MKKYTLTFLLLCIGFATVFSQGNLPFFNQASDHFAQKDYYVAAQYYEKFLATEKRSTPPIAVYSVQKKVKGVQGNRDLHQEAVYQLAESYRLCNDYHKAEKWYKEACSFPLSSYARARYWYAVCLRANEKYGEAMESLTKFLSVYNTMGPLLIDADREMDNLKFIQDQMAITKKDFLLSQVQTSIHSSVYALAVRQDDSVAFTAITKTVSSEKGGRQVDAYNNALYTSVLSDNFIDQGSQISNKTDDGLQEGLASFSGDGKKMYFTRWYKKAGKMHSSIFVSVWKGNSWTQPEDLGDQINVPGYNSTQPYITEDGHYLLFASDRPGGIGNYDIWYAALDSAGEILSVNNPGPVINTPGDEESPFFHQNSRTLIFASNGRVGMGGFDIYSSKGNINFSQWTKPSNPGAPLNSTKDDLYYTSTDKINCWNTGYLSSDRSTDCCLALFSVKQNNALLVQGRVIDCDSLKPIAGAVVQAIDTRHGGKSLGDQVTDSLGQYRFEIRNISEFQVSAGKNDYSQESKRYVVELKAGSDSLSTESICLKSTIVHTKEIKEMLNNLSKTATVGNFEYKKAKLNNSANTNLDSLASLMNRFPSIKVQIGGYTDGIGGAKYNIRLAQARVDACIKYLVKKGVDKNRLVGKAFGECCPLEPETINGKDNPAAREKNRRVEYLLLQEP